MPLASVPLPRRFEGRSVVVTGAGTGFGAEIAVRAAQEGARAVGVHYRSSADGAKRTADRVAAEGSTPLLLQADIVDWAQIKAMADAAFEQLGGVDVLVNNVGDVAREQMSWRDITEESIDHVLSVDIKGTLLCVHEFGSRMLDQGHGAIVNIGSTVIVRGSARAPQYAAAKYGILGLTKSYAHASRRPSGSTFSPRDSSRSRRPWDARTGRPARATSCDRSPRWGASRGPPSSPPGPVPRDRRRLAHDRRVHGRGRRLQHGRGLKVGVRHPRELGLAEARALVQRAVDKAEQLGLRGAIAVVGGPELGHVQGRTSVLAENLAQTAQNPTATGTPSTAPGPMRRPGVLAPQLHALWSELDTGVYLGDTDFTRRQDRFVSDDAYHRLTAIRAERDPSGRFASYLTSDPAGLNVHG